MENTEIVKDVNISEEKPVFAERYLVSSGGVEGFVNSLNHRQAAMTYILDHNSTSLGLIISIIKEGDSEEDEYFVATEGILKEMGFDFEFER